MEHSITKAIAKTKEQYICCKFKGRQKNLVIGDSRIIRVKWDKLKNSFDSANSFVRYFSGAVMQDLHHYAIPSLLKEKPDIVAIHADSNNITHRIFEDFNVEKLVDEIINLGMTCSQYGVNNALLFLLFWRTVLSKAKW